MQICIIHKLSKWIGLRNESVEAILKVPSCCCRILPQPLAHFFKWQCCCTDEGGAILSSDGLYLIWPLHIRSPDRVRNHVVKLTVLSSQRHHTSPSGVSRWTLHIPQKLMYIVCCACYGTTCPLYSFSETAVAWYWHRSLPHTALSTNTLHVCP